MRLTLTILLLYPFLLAAQCFATFETFAAAGFSLSPGEAEPTFTQIQPVTVARAGFGASFSVGKHLWLRTGVQLSQYGSQLRLSDDLRWGTQSNGNGGFDPNAPSGEPSFYSSSRHNYLEGLLALRYEFPTRRRLRPFAEGGVMLGAYFTSRYRQASRSGGVYDRRGDIRGLTPGARLSLGLNYQLTDKLVCFLAPTGQYQLTSYRKEGLPPARAWQLTLEAGVRIVMAPR